MVTTSVILDKELFVTRVRKMCNALNDQPLLIMLGKRADVTQFNLNSAVFNYLLGFEFSETVVIVQPVPIFYTSPKKANILAQLGDSIKILISEKENHENFMNFVNSLQSNYLVLESEVIKGDMCRYILEQINAESGDELILREFLRKEPVEIDNIHKAGTVANYLIPIAIEMVRDNTFSLDNLEKVLDEKIPGIDNRAIEISGTPQTDTNFVRIGVRYKGYCVEMGRKFMCECVDEYDIQKYVLSIITPGANSKNILEQTRNYIESSGYSNIISMYSIGHLDEELGFEKGFDLEEGMVFVLCIDNQFSNTFVLEEQPLFITKKDSAEDYAVRRMRYRNKAAIHELRAKIKEHQKELMDKLLEDMITYYQNRGNLDFVNKAKSHPNVSIYENDADVPRTSKISLDFEKNFVLIPILSHCVPYHISCIKNVSMNVVNEPKLRINFKESKEVREITGFLQHDTSLKSISVATPSAETLLNGINDMRRNYNKPQVVFKEQGELKLRKGKNIYMSDLIMKLDKKVGTEKVQSTLEFHENGFRYNDVHFLNSNIKKVFYQSGDYENPALIHFHLKESIPINGKPTKKIQFHKKQNYIFQDTTKRENEYLEQLREQEEEDRLYRVNKELTTFVEKIENETNLRPQFLQKGFLGVYHKETTVISITSDSFVSVNDSPFLVITLDDVEVVNFERAKYASTKTFDCVFVYKDKTHVAINSVDSTKLDFIKKTLDSMNMVFMETAFNINWGVFVQTIMSDPVSFYQNGGWADLLLEGEEEEEEESAEESDSESVMSSDEGDTDDDLSEETSEIVSESSYEEDDDSDDDSGFESSSEEYSGKKLKRRGY